MNEDVTLDFTITVTAAEAQAPDPDSDGDDSDGGDSDDSDGDDSDGDDSDGDSDSENRPPMITAPGDKVYAQGETIEPFPIEVTDPDDHDVAVGVSGLPSGLDYQDAAGEVAGTVSSSAALGEHAVTITASDMVNPEVEAVFTTTITVLDEDAPSVLVRPTSLAMPDGDSRTYQVRLRQQPSGPVTVSLATDALSADGLGPAFARRAPAGGKRVAAGRAAAAGASSAVRVTPGAFTVSPESWSEPRTVTVYGADPGTFLVRHALRGGGYDGVPASDVGVRVTGGDGEAGDSDDGGDGGDGGDGDGGDDGDGDDGDDDEDDDDRRKNLKPIFRATVSAPCFQVGTAIAPLVLPAAAGGAGALRYHLAPAPPAGLALDAGTRTLAGTPEAAGEETVYTWTARDEDGDETTLTFALTVLPDLRPTFGGVRGPALRGRAGRRMAPVTLPAATLPGAGGGGACGPGFDHDQPLEYRVTPELPAGLRFDARTRVVSGTPEAEQTRREHTLTATDADGDEAALKFSVTVIDPPVVNRIRIVSKPLAGDTYRYGERIEAEAVFSEPVTLTGSLTLGLTIGDAVRVLPSAPASGATVRFGHTVAGIDRDRDGVSVAANALALAGGRLVGAVGTDAELLHDPLPDQPGHRVDGRPRAVGTLPDLALTLGAAPAEVEVAEAFHGAETYEAVSSDPEVAAVALAGTMVTVTQRSDGVATVTVVGRNPGGTAEQPFAVRVVTAQAEIDVVAGALAGVGRTLLSSTSAVVGRRMERFGGGSTLMLAGRTLPLPAGRVSAGGRTFGEPGAGPWRGGSAGFGPGSPLPAPAGAEADAPLAAARRAYGSAGVAPGAGGPRVGRVTADELLYGSAFETTLGGSPAGFGQPAASGFVDGAAPAAGPRLTVWGAGDLQSLQGTIGPGSRYDARPLTTYVGADVAAGRLLAGLALARSRADADYEFHDLAADARGGGRLATRLLNVHPYVRWALDGQTDVWGIAGAGWGAAELARSVTHVGERSDLSLRLGMVGLRRTFRPGGAVGLALRGDAGWVRLATAGGGGAVLRGQAATGHRTRVGLEVLRQSGRVQPFVEVGGRYDGGDGAAGAGLEVAGGVRAASGAGRLGLEARGRLLALHTAAGYREAGLAVTLRVTPAGDGRGLALDLTPGWGAPAGGADSLWNDHGFGPLPGLAAPDGSFTARAGYGLGLVAPFTEVGWAAQRSRRLRVGVRVWEAAEAFEVELSGERYSDAGLPPAYRLGVFGSLRY